MRIVDDVNLTKVSPELLIEANMAVNDMGPADRGDLTARIIEVIKMLDAKKFSQRKRQDLLTAIDFRLTALARLEDDKHKEMEAWSIPGGEKGMIFAHEDIFTAAALEPLVQKDEQLHFNPESFFKRLLDISKAHGRG